AASELQEPAARRRRWAAVGPVPGAGPHAGDIPDARPGRRSGWGADDGWCGSRVRGRSTLRGLGEGDDGATDFDEFRKGNRRIGSGTHRVHEGLHEGTLSLVLPP